MRLADAQVFLFICQGAGCHTFASYFAFDNGLALKTCDDFDFDLESAVVHQTDWQASLDWHTTVAVVAFSQLGVVNINNCVACVSRLQCTQEQMFTTHNQTVYQNLDSIRDLNSANSRGSTTKQT